MIEILLTKLLVLDISQLNNKKLQHYFSEDHVPVVPAG